MKLERSSRSPSCARMPMISMAELINTNQGAGKYTSIAADINGVYISYYDNRSTLTDPAHPEVY